MQAFEMSIDGRLHEATWETGDHDRLTVTSAVGTTYAYRDGRDPQALAKSLLQQLVFRAQRQAG